MSGQTGRQVVNLVDLHQRCVYKAQVQWNEGVIMGIERRGEAVSGQPFLLPGFVDAHVHIESSMLVPAEFARMAARHGTVACVSDPHEIANVLGLAGVRYMLQNARQSGAKIYFGAPSCVPATTFETAGAKLDSTAVRELLNDPDIHYLSEMMNFPGVLRQDEEVMRKLEDARQRGLPVDGHAPGLTGAALLAYAGAGITTDHECTTLAEAREKIAAGMCILIREGSAARDFDALHPLIGEHPDRVMFCSDDKHPDDLVNGHIDRLLARSVALGYDLFDCLRVACVNPVIHYRLPVGQLRQGDAMDAVLVEDLRQFRVLATWQDGREVARDGKSCCNAGSAERVNRFAPRLPDQTDFALPLESERIRVIEAVDGSLYTRSLSMPAMARDGLLQADIEHDVLWLAVVNRYRPQPPALAWVKGFALRQGAIASSVAHDSHNLIAVGTDPRWLLKALHLLMEARGGIAAAGEAGELCLPLPIAGLMSDRDGDWVAQRYTELNRLVAAMGCPLRAPFMTLSFMALLVIPELKLSDKGLFDVGAFAFTSMWPNAVNAG